VEPRNRTHPTDPFPSGVYYRGPGLLARHPISPSPRAHALCPPAHAFCPPRPHHLTPPLPFPYPSPTPLVPRAPWMMEGDARTDDEADVDWRTAMEVLFPPTVAPLPARRQTQQAELRSPPLPPSPWPAPPWGSTPATEPSSEPDSHLSHRNNRRTVLIRALDPSNLLTHETAPAHGPSPLPTKDYNSDDSLESYVSTKRRSLSPSTQPPHTGSTIALRVHCVLLSRGDSIQRLSLSARSLGPRFLCHPLHHCRH
jgi:hypothetical protein